MYAFCPCNLVLVDFLLSLPFYGWRIKRKELKYQSIHLLHD